MIAVSVPWPALMLTRISCCRCLPSIMSIPFCRLKETHLSTNDQVLVDIHVFSCGRCTGGFATVFLKDSKASSIDFRFPVEGGRQGTSRLRCRFCRYAQSLPRPRTLALEAIIW